jgi:hypothetical protein
MASSAMEQVMNESSAQTPEPRGLVLPPNIQLFTFFDRVYDSLVGCSTHEWSFPFTSPGQEYPEGYDSHRSCTACGKQQLYNFRKARPGQLFRFLLAQPEGFDD